MATAPKIHRPKDTGQITRQSVRAAMTSIPLHSWAAQDTAATIWPAPQSKTLVLPCR